MSFSDSNFAMTWMKGELSVALLATIYGALFVKRAKDPKQAEGEKNDVMEEKASKSSTNEIDVNYSKMELPKALKEHLKRPTVAWPTVFLCVFSTSLWVYSIYGYVGDFHNKWVSTFLSTLAVYWSFTVLHDAVHNAITPKSRFINDLVGYVGGVPLLAPLNLFRYVHLMHHKYAGVEGLDPDMWAGEGPQLLLPLRWATVFLAYISTYAGHMRYRVAEEGGLRNVKWSTFILLVEAGVWAYVVKFSLFALFDVLPEEKKDAVVYSVLLPQLIGTAFLMYLFDYVPHRPHKISYRDDPFRSTNATSFLGNVDGVFITSFTMQQNLHNIHHVWPFMPFYTYKSLWRIYGDEFLQKGMRIVPLFCTKPMSEYFDELKSPMEEKKKRA